MTTIKVSVSDLSPRTKSIVRIRRDKGRLQVGFNTELDNWTDAERNFYTGIIGSLGRDLKVGDSSEFDLCCANICVHRVARDYFQVCCHKSEHQHEGEPEQPKKPKQEEVHPLFFHKWMNFSVTENSFEEVLLSVRKDEESTAQQIQSYERTVELLQEKNLDASVSLEAVMESKKRKEELADFYELLKKHQHDKSGLKEVLLCTQTFGDRKYRLVDFTGTTVKEAIEKILTFYKHKTFLKNIYDNTFFEGFNLRDGKMYMNLFCFKRRDTPRVVAAF